MSETHLIKKAAAVTGLALYIAVYVAVLVGTVTLGRIALSALGVAS